MRYVTLLHLIHVFKPQSIIEIGTWSGDNAIRMMKNAQPYSPNIHYTGFDLFEEATAETDAIELNVKCHNRAIDIETKIRNATVGFGIVKLFKGNTRKTLNEKHYADFVFIDGGHSVETIEHDYDAVKHNRIVVLDDYYTPDLDGKCPDIEKYGCNKLVDRLRNSGNNCLVLPGCDVVKDGGFNQLVLVV